MYFLLKKRYILTFYLNFFIFLDNLIEEKAMNTPIDIDKDSRNKMIFTIIEHRPEKIRSTQMAKFVSEIFGISDKTAYNIWYNIKLIDKDDLFKTDVRDDIRQSIDKKIQETQSKNTTKGDLKGTIFKLQKAIKDSFYNEKKLTSNLLAEIVHHLLTKEFGAKLDESRPFNAKKDEKSRVGYILNLIKGAAAKDGRKTKNAKLTDQQKETIEKFLAERNKEKNITTQKEEMIEQPSSNTSQTNSFCKDCEALKEENTKLIDLNKAYRLILTEKNQI